VKLPLERAYRVTHQFLAIRRKNGLVWLEVLAQRGQAHEIALLNELEQEALDQYSRCVTESRNAGGHRVAEMRQDQEPEWIVQSFNGQMEDQLLESIERQSVSRTRYELPNLPLYPEFPYESGRCL